MAAILCRGTRKNGEPCRNPTTNETGWCGKCKSPAGVSRNSSSSNLKKYLTVQNPELAEPISKTQRYSGPGAEAIREASQSQTDRLREIGFSGGLEPVKVKLDDAPEQIVTTDYLEAGVWETGTTIPIKEYFGTLQYNPVVADEPFNDIVVASYSFKENDYIVPAQVAEGTTPSGFQKKCSECDREVDDMAHLVMNSENKYVTVCQRCYVGLTKSKNKYVLEDLYHAIEGNNMVYDNDIMPLNVFDGTVVRVMSYAAVRHAVAQGSGALDYFRNYVNSDATKVVPITQKDIAEAKNIDHYAFLAQNSDFLKPEERAVFEKLMAPGYREKDFPEIVKGVSQINEFDEEAIARTKLIAQGNAGVLPLGSIGQKTEIRITDVRDVGDLNYREFDGIGVDGRNYTWRAGSGNVHLFMAKEGFTVMAQDQTQVTGTVTRESNEYIPYHELSGLENAPIPTQGGVCGVNKHHAYHTTKAPFFIFSKAIRQGMDVRICVDCGDIRNA